jgi:hypothetical protein
MVTKKSGLGISDGVVSELTAFFNVVPGQEENLRKALERFANTIRTMDPEQTQKTGLRDTRHVIFDNGRRLLWTTTFETDWDPYLDDAIAIVGVKAFIDWMKYLVEADVLRAWLTSAGGPEDISSASGEALLATVQQHSGGLKKIIQSAQTPAAAYWNALAEKTIPQIRKSLRVESAFEEVLDNPAAGSALSNPALGPLLQQASH